MGDFTMVVPLMMILMMMIIILQAGRSQGVYESVRVRDGQKIPDAAQSA